jgi:hypothetical protein
MTNIDQELQDAFREIQMSRTPYALDKLVVKTHFTPEQQYVQCVVEIQNAYYTLRLAGLDCRKKELELATIPDTDIGRIDREIKELELEQARLGMLGRERELQALVEIWRSFPQRYTRRQIDAASRTEYERKLSAQSVHDLMAMGRVSVGNLEGLRQVGIRDEFLKMAGATDKEQQLPRKLTEVYERYHATGKCRVLIGVPTEKKAERDGKAYLPYVEGLVLPGYVEVKLLNQYGHPVADNYNMIAQHALSTDADFVITIEDDMVVPPDAVVRLLELVKAHPRCAVGAWYTRKQVPRESAHISVTGAYRGPVPDDGGIHEVCTLAMGCSIYPIAMFKEIPAPWFVTISGPRDFTQDSYFSQLAREAGWKLLVDSSLKAKHVCRKTGKVWQ